MLHGDYTQKVVLAAFTEARGGYISLMVLQQWDADSVSMSERLEAVRPLVVLHLQQDGLSTLRYILAEV